MSTRAPAGARSTGPVSTGALSTGAGSTGPLGRWWPRLQVLAGVAVLVALASQLGADAFVDGLRALDAGSVLAALVLGLLTTVLSAGRWWLVARRLGVVLPPTRAVGDTYRAQFLNSVLPAGVLGDVHRAMSHGRCDGRAARAVVLERVAGQTVVVAVGAAVVLGSGVSYLGPDLVNTGTHPLLAVGVGAVGVVAVVAVVTLAAVRGPWAARVRSALRTGLADVRGGVLSRGAWPWVVMLSVAGLAGHLALFVVAARSAGVQVPLGELLPLLVAALLAMVVPLNVGGWGPREAVAAVGFGAAGYGAAQGLTVAVAFGVLGLIACLPGAAVLLLHRTGAAGTASGWRHLAWRDGGPPGRVPAQGRRA